MISQLQIPMNGVPMRDRVGGNTAKVVFIFLHTLAEIWLYSWSVNQSLSVYYSTFSDGTITVVLFHKFFFLPCFSASQHKKSSEVICLKKSFLLVYFFCFYKHAHLFDFSNVSVLSFACFPVVSRCSILSPLLVGYFQV